LKNSLSFFLSYSARRQFEENPDYHTEIFPGYSSSFAQVTRIYRVDLDALRSNFKIPTAATGCETNVVYLW